MTVVEAGESSGRLTRRGDSLFMLAYRCWHAGFDYGDAECWQYAWTALSNALGPREARPVLGAIEDFVRTLRAVSPRQLEYYPPPCCRMSDSERQVLQLVAALQASQAEVDDLIETLCGPLAPDAQPLVLAHGRALAASLLDVGIAVLAPRPPLRSLH
ncbi:MAG: hypothetical protein ACOC9Q_00505 [bacterium]